MSEAMVILFVKSQDRSREFYRALLQREPSTDVEGMTMFEVGSGLTIGLMPEAGIARILGDSMPHPSSGNGIPRCELYLFVNDPEHAMERLVQSGGRCISELADRDWGDRVAYGSDPDGHIIALAEKK